MSNEYTLKFGRKLRITIDQPYYGWCFTIRKGVRPLARSITFGTRSTAWDAAVEFVELYDNLVDYLVEGKFEVWSEPDE